MISRTKPVTRTRTAAAISELVFGYYDKSINELKRRMEELGTYIHGGGYCLAIKLLLYVIYVIRAS